MAKTKVCKICGKKYEYCGNCGGAPVRQTWRNEFCCEDCLNIFQVCCRYVGKDISKEDAYHLLKIYNIDNKVAQESVKETVDEIMTAVISNKKIETKSVISNVESDEKVVVESVDEAPRKRMRRRRTKDFE